MTHHRIISAILEELTKRFPELSNDGDRTGSDTITELHEFYLQILAEADKPAEHPEVLWAVVDALRERAIRTAHVKGGGAGAAWIEFTYQGHIYMVGDSNETWAGQVYADEEAVESTEAIDEAGIVTDVKPRPVTRGQLAAYAEDVASAIVRALPSCSLRVDAAIAKKNAEKLQGEFWDALSDLEAALTRMKGQEIEVDGTLDLSEYNIDTLCVGAEEELCECGREVQLCTFGSDCDQHGDA